MKNSNKIPKLDTSKIVQVRLAENQYYQEEFPKKQIVLHHTVSNGNAKNVMQWWNKTPSRVGVAFIIDREGIIYQCFSSKHWAHHLGTKSKQNKQLNQESIGIEMCSWGGLTRKESNKLKGSPSFYSTTGTKIPREDVNKADTTFRGFDYFQIYTNKQLKSLLILLVYLCETYQITTKYHADMWDYSRMAISGNPGIYTHLSFRKDKSDCFPQKELIEILSELG